MDLFLLPYYFLQWNSLRYIFVDFGGSNKQQILEEAINNFKSFLKQLIYTNPVKQVLFHIYIQPQFELVTLARARIMFASQPDLYFYDQEFKERRTLPFSASSTRTPYFEQSMQRSTFSQVTLSLCSNNNRHLVARFVKSSILQHNQLVIDFGAK